MQDWESERGRLSCKTHKSKKKNGQMHRVCSLNTPLILTVQLSGVCAPCCTVRMYLSSQYTLSLRSLPIRHTRTWMYSRTGLHTHASALWANKTLLLSHERTEIRSLPKSSLGEHDLGGAGVERLSMCWCACVRERGSYCIRCSNSGSTGIMGILRVSSVWRL